MLPTYQIAQCYDPEDYIVQECPNLGSPASVVRPSSHSKLCLHYKHSTIIRKLCIPIIMIVTRSDCGHAQAVAFCLKKKLVIPGIVCVCVCVYVCMYIQ